MRTRVQGMRLTTRASHAISNTQFEHGTCPPTLWGSYSAEETALSLGPHMATSASNPHIVTQGHASIQRPGKRAEIRPNPRASDDEFMCGHALWLRR